MDRDPRNINTLLTFGLLLTTTLFSCGPRTGIHEEAQLEANNYSPVDTSSPVFKRDMKINEAFDKGNTLFKQYCAVCHAGRSDQRLTGPGLKGLADRLPKPQEDWFVNYTLNCDSIFRSGDKYAKQLRKEYEGTQMPVFSGQLTRDQVKIIYSYLIAPPRQRGCVFD